MVEKKVNINFKEALMYDHLLILEEYLSYIINPQNRQVEFTFIIVVHSCFIKQTIAVNILNRVVFGLFWILCSGCPAMFGFEFESSLCSNLCSARPVPV